MKTKEQELAIEAGFDIDGMQNMLYTVRGNHAQLERLIKIVSNQALEDAAVRFEDLHLYGTKTADTKGVAAILRSMKDKP